MMVSMTLQSIAEPVLAWFSKKLVSATGTEGEGRSLFLVIG